MGLETEKGLRLQIEASEAAIAEAWMGNVAWLRSQQTIADIAELLSERRLSEIVTDANLERFAAAVANASWKEYLAAADVVADYLARKLEHPVHFDATDGRAMVRIQGNQLDLIREVTDETRAVIRNAIRDGIELGMSPRAHARLIRGSIGLTEHQQQIVKNFRQKLLDNDGSALDNTLRDRRFDSSVRAAAAGNEPLTPAQVEKMVARYQDRWITYRSEAISRTEALRSVHEGIEDMWGEAVDRGDVNVTQMERIWRHKRLAGRDYRENHLEMNGQRRAFGQMFHSPSGVSLRYPCDPDAPASETVHCKCCVVTRFKRAS
jgi:hypothetical protein